MNTKDLTGKRVLLLSSPYHGFYNKIAKVLNDMGAMVVSFSENPKVPFYYKILYSNLRKVKLLFNYCEYFRIRHQNYIYSKLSNSNFDYIIVIKGMGVDNSFLEKLNLKFANSKKILYQWDSLLNHNYHEKIKYFDNIYSFDLNDSLKYNKIKYLPLFYSDEYKQIGEEKIEKYLYDVFFLGVAQPARLQSINDIICIFENKKIKYNIYLVTDWVSKLKKKYKNTKYISLIKTMKFTEFREKYVYSKAILDISSPRQSGLSIRVIEAVGAQKKIITTNELVVNESFYNKNNIFIIGKDSWDDFPDFLHNDYIQIDNNDYSIKSFVNKLLN